MNKIRKDAVLVKGVVKELDVSGTGPSSGQLEFVVTEPNGVNHTVTVEMDTEARVFASMASLLAIAYHSAITVAVAYLPVTGGAGKAVNVIFPPKS